MQSLTTCLHCRRLFCDAYDGYGDVCACKQPKQLQFSNKEPILYVCGCALVLLFRVVGCARMYLRLHLSLPFWPIHPFWPTLAHFGPLWPALATLPPPSPLFVTRCTDSELSSTAVVVMASEHRAKYLMRSLVSLLSADGGDPNRIVVSIDGTAESEPEDVCGLLGVQGAVVSNAPAL